MDFWLTNHRFQAPFKNWTQEYLTKKEYRITYLVRDYLGNDYWHIYSQVITDFVKRKRLLFRAKISTEDAIYFTQIWENEKAAVEFERLVEKTGSPTEILKKLNFQVKIEKKPVTMTQAQDLIQQTIKQSAVIQYVNEPFVVEGIDIGDPLKVGDQYLPFPRHHSE